jgi:DNA-binding CsgD family transcriptional regulator
VNTQGVIDRDAPAGPERRHSAELIGRRDECGVLDRLAEDVRAGHSRILVIRGAPGMGKTALLEYAASRASDCLVVSASGAPPETELEFGALHRVCAPVLDQLDALPAPQRDALRITFGLSHGPPPDQFLVALASLSLLTQAAAERPLICLVDDAQWLDRTSARLLNFVASRLAAVPVGLLFATRGLNEDLAGLPALELPGLRAADARALLGSALTGPFDPRIRDQVVAEAHGNPGMLLDLPKAASPAKLAGGFGLLCAIPPESTGTDSIDDSVLRQCRNLPAESRRLLLLAACEPTGDPVVIWQAAARSGISTAAAEPAVETGLVEFGMRARFAQPRARHAVYWSATVVDRREAHRALAEATDPCVNPDGRAWHRAQSAAGPDEGIAGELERFADRARAGGRLAVAAAFLDRSAWLTPDPARLAGRAMRAARAKIAAGAPDAAQGLLALAESVPLTDADQARAQLLRGQAAFTANQYVTAPVQLLRAAERLALVDAGLCRAAYLEALLAACYAGRLADPAASVQAIARAACSAPPPPSPEGAEDLLLDGLATLFGRGYAAGQPLAREALRVLCGDLSAHRDVRWLWLAHGLAAHVWDDECCGLIADWCARLARQGGAIGDLPLALTPRLNVLFARGDLAAAGDVIEEMEAVREVTVRGLRPYGAIHLAALRGAESEASALIERVRANATRTGDGFGISSAHWSSAVLNNGLGRYREALAAAQVASENVFELGVPNWSLVELIEAAARSGEPEIAAGAYRRLAAMTSASGTDWGLGIQARSRALLRGEERHADQLYRESIERLGRTSMRAELARAHLLYGEWLLDRQRRNDARPQLRTALDLLEDMGMPGFAGRASGALRAAGQPRKRSAAHRKLTDQETRIALLARDGLSNAEIAARLFLSTSTIQYHLSKVFTKLAISSRGHLYQVMDSLWRR